MKLIIGTGGTPFSDVTMTHGDVNLVWSYTAFKRPQGKQGKEISISNMIFDEINAFWAQVPEQRQDQIFSVYVRIKETFESIQHTKALTSTLQPLLAELFDYQPLEEFEHWVRYHSRIRIPDKIEKIEKFVESDDVSITRQKTYTRDDYQKLIVLALALRVVVPVWGELVAFTEKHKILGTHWKEYAAYQLLGRTPLMECEAMNKLRTYVHAYIPTDRSKRPYSAIMAGVGSEDFPEWLLGVIVFRRVCIGDISNSNPESHMVSSIHSYILNRLSPSESSFIGHVREKNTKEKEGTDTESKLSRLENYKTRQELSEGDVAIIVHTMRDPFFVLNRVSPETPMALLETSLKSVQALMSHRIQEPQLKIMQYVLARACKPRGLQYLPKNIFLNALAVAQAVLWHRGHYEIAGLVSARADETGAEYIEPNMSHHGRISKDLIERLNVLYPYMLRSTSKQQKESGKTQNAAIVAINQVSDMLGDYGWTLTLPSDWVNVLNPGQPTRRYSAPKEIRNKLAELVIQVATRSL